MVSPFFFCLLGIKLSLQSFPLSDMREMRLRGHGLSEFIVSSAPRITLTKRNALFIFSSPPETFRNDPSLYSNDTNSNK